VAPSGPVDMGRVQRGLAHVRAHFGPGAPQLAPNLAQRSGYFAGDDATRFEALSAALQDPDLRVLWAARGGYGATRLLRRLDPAWARGKLIVGFSDITALMCWAWTAAGQPSIHGPVVAQLDALDPGDRERLWDLLAGELPVPLVAEGEGAGSLCGGRVEGTLMPANLEVLRSLVGTPFLPSMRGAIVALEEVGERPYRLDRALTQLLDSGALRGVAGFAIGQLHACNEPAAGGSQGWSAREVVEDRLARLGVPVVTGLPFGHAPGRNAAIPFGVRGRLDADQGSLEVLEPLPGFA